MSCGSALAILFASADFITDVFFCAKAHEQGHTTFFNASLAFIAIPMLLNLFNIFRLGIKWYYGPMTGLCSACVDFLNRCIGGLFKDKFMDWYCNSPTMFKAVMWPFGIAWFFVWYGFAVVFNAFLGLLCVFFGLAAIAE